MTAGTAAVRRGRRVQSGAALEAARAEVGAFWPERLVLGSVVGLPSGHEAACRRVMGLCRPALACGPGRAEALRLWGLAATLLGRDAEGLAALDQALKLDPRQAEGWAWRALALLLGGMAAKALADLDKAVALAPGRPWERILRAVCLLSLGRCEEAARDLRAAEPCPEAAAGSAAVGALLEGQRGEPRAGLRRLEPLLKASPRGCFFAIRAILRRDASDVAGSLSDWRLAAEREPSAWVLSQHADALNRSGFYQQALEQLGRVKRVLPRSPLPFLQSANILFDQAFYPEALAEMGRALRRSPRDADLLARRARFYFLTGRLALAEADLRRAQDCSPDREQLRFERLQVLSLMGREGAVLKSLRAWRLGEPFSGFLRGTLHCRARRFALSEREFRAAARAASGPFADKCRLFAHVARVLAEPDPNPPAQEALVLCGVGIRHPFQATVEMIRALSRCDVIYNNLGDPQMCEFLGLFRGRLRAVRRVIGEPAMGRVQRIVAAIRPGLSYGFVTRIHPFMYRRIANDLATACRERGIGLRAFGAVSLTELAWGLGEAREHSGGRVLPSPMALRVFDVYYLTRNPALLAPASPAVIYCIAPAEVRRALCSLLSRLYPASHRAYLLAGSGDKEQEVQPFPLKELEPGLLAADLGAVLYVPASGG